MNVSALRSQRRAGGWCSAGSHREARCSTLKELERSVLFFSLCSWDTWRSFPPGTGVSTFRGSDWKRLRGIPVCTRHLPADHEPFRRRMQQEQGAVRACPGPSDVPSFRCSHRCWEELLLTHAWKARSSKCLYIYVHLTAGGYTASLSSTQGRNSGERCCLPGRCWLWSEKLGSQCS